MKKNLIYGTKIRFILLLLTTHARAVVPYLQPKSLCHTPALSAAALYQVIAEPCTDSILSLVCQMEGIYTFRPDRIAQCLGGNALLSSPKHCPDNGRQLPLECPEKRICRSLFLVEGSQAAQRNHHAWLADYFGLAPDFKSTVSIKPHITTIAGYFNAYVDLERYVSGVYATLKIPIAHSSWNVSLCESIESTGTTSYEPGYVNSTGVERPHLLSSFTSYVSGCNSPDTQPTIFEPLTNACISSHALHTTAIADIAFTLGWKCVENSRGIVRLFMTGILPTGSKPHGQFLFEPIVGNGRHPEIGIGFLAQGIVWERPLTDEQCSGYIDFSVSHLWPACQRRTFDIKNRPLSRYMLAAQLDSPNVDNLTGNSEGNLLKAPSVFGQLLVPIANITTLKIESKVNAQIEGTLLFSYDHAAWTFTIGYNFFWQSREKIYLKESLKGGNDRWVIKGDAYVMGFLGAADDPLPLYAPIPLAVSQQNATIAEGTTMALHQTTDLASNNGIDNPYDAFAGTHNEHVLIAPNISDTVSNGTHVSLDPIFLSTSDIDTCSAATRQLSNTLFTYLTYAISPCACIDPFIGFGARAEFGSPAYQECEYPSNGKNSAFSAWGVWITLGFTM